MTGPDPNTPSAYPRGQRFSTDDVKAAIEDVLEVYPDAEIWFNDAHGKSMNVYFEEFPENVKIVVNSAELFDEALGINNNPILSFASALTVTLPSLICHIWDVRAVEFNGKSLTEIA